MNATDKIHVIHPERADGDFAAEMATGEWYVLLWSQRQNGFHIERFRNMLDSNRRAYADDRSMDYVPLVIGKHEFCCQMADSLRGTVRRREEAKQAARQVLEQFQLRNPIGAGHSVTDIVNALERYAAELERRADKLVTDLDYGAEFPATDAALLREAIALVAGASPRRSTQVVAGRFGPFEVSR